ncbi:MAG: hypothetical protein JXQ72_14540 [Anaerolineae bacterium]|nr:hypothetical protein [Anaerolineae bacterium]
MSARVEEVELNGFTLAREDGPTYLSLPAEASLCDVCQFYACPDSLSQALKAADRDCANLTVAQALRSQDITGAWLAELVAMYARVTLVEGADMSLAAFLNGGMIGNVAAIRVPLNYPLRHANGKNGRNGENSRNGLH